MKSICYVRAAGEQSAPQDSSIEPKRIIVSELIHVHSPTHSAATDDACDQIVAGGMAIDWGDDRVCFDGGSLVGLAGVVKLVGARDHGRWLGAPSPIRIVYGDIRPRRRDVDSRVSLGTLSRRFVAHRSTSRALARRHDRLRPQLPRVSVSDISCVDESFERPGSCPPERERLGETVNPRRKAIRVWPVVADGFGRVLSGGFHALVVPLRADWTRVLPDVFTCGSALSNVLVTVLSHLVVVVVVVDYRLAANLANTSLRVQLPRTAR